LFAVNSYITLPTKPLRFQRPITVASGESATSSLEEQLKRVRQKINIYFSWGSFVIISYKYNIFIN